MNTLRFLAMLALFFMGCGQSSDDLKRSNSGVCNGNALESDDTPNGTTYLTGRGALLGSRFTSLEALKSVIQIEYGADIVVARHCSSGKEVVSILENGTSQGDILKARYQGAIWDRVTLLFRCPFAVMNRKDIESIFLLSRRQPEWFGEGDPAFFDLAKASVENINTPELAFKNARDSTEKGYLNSFNHITASAFTTSCFSEELADFITDSHERYRHPELITGIFTDAQVADLDEGPVDNYVDLINNEWGQELGKQLKEKYHITRETNWTPELLANYLNDLQRYYSWAFQVGFSPFRPEDKVVLKFSYKLGAVINSTAYFNR